MSGGDGFQDDDDVDVDGSYHDNDGEEHLDVFSGNSDHACTRLYAGGDAHQLSMSIPAILTREDSLIEPLSRTSLRMVGVKFS